MTYALRSYTKLYVCTRAMRICTQSVSPIQRLFLSTAIGVYGLSFVSLTLVWEMVSADRIAIVIVRVRSDRK